MDIVELIEEVGGVDALGIQFVDQSAIKFQKMKDHNRITIVTDQGFDLNGAEQFGVLVWMDRDKAKQAFTKARARKPSQKGDK